MKVWTAEYLGLMPSSGEKAKRRRGESTRPTATTGSKRVERSGDLVSLPFFLPFPSLSFDGFRGGL